MQWSVVDSFHCDLARFLLRIRNEFCTVTQYLIGDLSHRLLGEPIVVIEMHYRCSVLNAKIMQHKFHNMCLKN